MKSGHCFLVGFFCMVVLTTVSGTISQQLSDASNQFSVDLVKTVLHEQSGNVVVSPVSIHILLAILQQGARSNSRTQLNNVLHALPDETKEGYHNLTTVYKNVVLSSPASINARAIDFATRAFVGSGKSILPEFKQSLVSDFLSDIDSVDFSDSTAAADHINSWVAQNTHNRITQLFTPESIRQDTALVVVNAVYFMSQWFHGFSAAVDKPFSPRPNEEKQVPSLYQEEYYRSGINTELGAKWVQLSLDFWQPKFSVLLVLPTERHGLDSLVNRLTFENYTTLFSHGNVNHVKLTLPKFTLSTESNLIPLLRQLGINDIFGSSADLSGISEQPLFVSDVVQKAEIALDEKGITAAAATGVVAVPISLPYYPEAVEFEFKADEPFLFYIADNYHHVSLFAGRVSDPSSH